MSKFNPTIQAKVVLEEGTSEEYELIIPISVQEFMILQNKIKGKDMRIKEVVTNCYISTQKLLKKEDNVIAFCLQLQNLIQDLNMLSNKEEVQALTECVTSDIEELVKFVKKGMYHFYPELTVEDLEEGITTIGDESSAEEITSKNLNTNGYFEASTGIIYIPEKSTK